MKTDASGVLQWQKKIGGNLSDEGRSLTFAVDGGIVMAGDSNSTNGDISELHGGYDLWVVKLQPELSVSEINRVTMNLSPNPVKDLLQIQLTSGRIPEKTTITDLAGKTLIDSDSTLINMQNLSSGIYIVKVISQNETFTQKIIKE
ncbi:T9SS type A sorting domain-containing protein [Flavobacterium sp. 3HN19-14]|uniref:T9SS type A sorting domain-containing protein n=1 Tax=Flavobacterium sp. 3HN19-14 TaxID=3448133 RepID=UPI003EE38FFC